MNDFQLERMEVERRADFYYHSEQQLGIDNRTRSFVIKSCMPYVQRDHVLELGYVDGLWTDELLHHNLRVDIVEGASRHVAHAQTRYAGNAAVRVFHNIFQEFTPPQHYNTVIAGDMIRYLADPEAFLMNVKSWLAPQGRLVITVPNSRSMHRRIGTLINMESTPTEANQRDQEVGNQRSYDRYELRALLQSTNWQIEALHGCFLKPLSSQQIENWSDELLQAFFLMGQELEDYCWFLYAVCHV